MSVYLFAFCTMLAPFFVPLDCLEGNGGGSSVNKRHLLLRETSRVEVIKCARLPRGGKKEPWRAWPSAVFFFASPLRHHFNEKPSAKQCGARRATNALKNSLKRSLYAITLVLEYPMQHKVIWFHSSLSKSAARRIHHLGEVKSSTKITRRFD